MQLGGRDLSNAAAAVAVSVATSVPTATMANNHPPVIDVGSEPNGVATTTAAADVAEEFTPTAQTWPLMIVGLASVDVTP